MGRRGQLAATAVLLLVITVPGLLTLAGAGSERLVDNRAPTPLPALGGTALLRRDTYAQLGQALQDRLAGRNEAIDLDARIDQSLFHGDAPLVERGRAGWLFLAPTELECDAPALDAAVASILDQVTRAAPPGADIALAVVPEKAAVFPDRLAADDEERARCAPAAMADLSRRTAPQPQVVDVFGALRQARTQPPPGLDAPDQLYLRLDTHWTSSGAGVAAAEILDRLRPGVWHPDAVEVQGHEAHTGDLTRLLGRPATEQTWLLAPRRPGVSVDSSAPGRSEATSTEGAALVSGRTVVLQDSFGEALWAHLSPYLADATYLNWDTLDANRLRAVLADADSVIVESVARQVEAVAERIGG